MQSIKVCEYSRSRSFHDDLILQDQASGERSQDHWSSGSTIKEIFPFGFHPYLHFRTFMYTVKHYNDINSCNVSLGSHIYILL